MKKLILEFRRADERGSLTQVNTGKWRQLNCLLIKKGETFGGHYHKHRIELFYCLRGSIRFKVENMLNKDKKIFYFKTGDCLLIEPFDKHTLYAREDTEIVELLNKPYDKEDSYG